MADNKVEIQFGVVNLGVLKSGLGNVTSQVQSSINKMTDSFKAMSSQIGGVINSLKSTLLSFGVTLGGVFVFTKAISATMEFTDEVHRLAATLGMTYSAATTLNIAMKEIGMSTDGYLGIANKLFMGLARNEKAFHDLGVEVRDKTTGAFLSEQTIMTNAINVLLKYEAGTNRTVVAKQMFRRASGEVIDELVRLANEMEHARTVQEQLGLTVGKEGVDRMFKYRESTADMKLALTALSGEITSNAIPTMLDLTKIIIGVVKPAIFVLKTAFLTLKLAALGIGEAINLVIDIFVTFIETIRAGAKVIVDILSGQWAKVPTDAEIAWNTLKTGFKRTMDNLVDYGNKAIGMIRDTFKAPIMLPETPITGGKGAPPGKEPEKSRMSQWEAELAAQRDAFEKMKLEQGSFIEYSLTQERDFWKKKLDTVKMTEAEKAEVSKRYFALEKDIRKTNFASEIMDLKAQIDDYKKGGEERITAAKEIARKIGIAYGTESVQYKQAMIEVERLTREHVEQMKKLSELEVDRKREYNLSLIELEKERLATELELGNINKTQELAALKKLTDQEYEIDLKALEDKRDLLRDDVIAYQEMCNKILALKQKHNLDMKKLDDQVVIETKKKWEGILSPITSAISTAVQGIVLGTTTIKRAIQNLATSVLAEFADMGVKMLVNWIATKLALTATTRVTQVSQMIADSAVVFAGVFANLAPMLGPLAAGPAGAAQASVLAQVPLVAAAGGYDVPADITARLHAKEMVLPADIAEKVRGMADTGKRGGDLIINIQATDAKSFTDRLKDNNSELCKILKKAHRDFRFSN